MLPVKPRTPRKHKIERLDLNIESIITETLLESQLKAKKEAQMLAEKSKNDRANESEQETAEEVIEEDIIVFQNKNYNQNTPSARINSEKVNQEIFKNQMYNQIQKKTAEALNNISTKSMIKEDLPIEQSQTRNKVSLLKLENYSAR